MPAIGVVNDIFKIIGTAGDSVRFASKPGFIDNMAKRLDGISDVGAGFVRDKVILGFKNGDNPISVMTKLSKGNIAVSENVKHFIKTQYPLNDYFKWIDETNAVARKIGFKDEAHFAKFISDLDLNNKGIRVKDTQKLGNIYQYIKNYVAKHPSSVLKAAIAGGSLAMMVSYLKNFQAENTGCFRYEKDDENNLIRYKFRGNFCLDNSTDSNNSDSDEVKILSDNQHPLYNVTNKWDCDYSQFQKGNSTVDEILNAGCNGLCDWLNFNTLTGLTNGDEKFDPLIIDEDDDNKYYMYIYKCEKATILRAITSGVSNVVDETITGFAQSQLGRKTIEFLKSQFGQFVTFTLILVLIYLSINALSKHRWMVHVKEGGGNVEETQEVIIKK